MYHFSNDLSVSGEMGRVGLNKDLLHNVLLKRYVRVIFKSDFIDYNVNIVLLSKDGQIISFKYTINRITFPYLSTASHNTPCHVPLMETTLPPNHASSSPCAN